MVPLMTVPLLLLAACGRVADPAQTAPAPSTSDPIVVASSTPLGALRSPMVLPATDGTWIIVDREEVSDAEVEDSLPCVWWHPASVGRLTKVSPGSGRSELVAADGSEIFVSGVSPLVTTPPTARVGDPIAVSSLRCDPRSDEPTRTLLLGVIGEDGTPQGLSPILGLGAPIGAPPITPNRMVEFAPTFSADRSILVVTVTIDCTAEITCHRSELWNFDLRTRRWSERDDPSYKGYGRFGAPLVLSDGSLLEIFDEGMSQWTTFRGSLLFDGDRRDTYGVGASLAPDGSAILLRVSSREDTQRVEILGLDGSRRTVYEVPASESPEMCCASYGADAQTIYLGRWSHPSGQEAHLSLWSVDVATGMEHRLIDVPGASSFILLPDASGLLVPTGGPSTSTWGAVWELWTFARSR